MSNEMEEFELLLKVTPPEPSDQARKAAIDRGMDAFDQHFSKKSQGLANPHRLMDALRTVHNSLLGGFSMKHSKLIAGGLTLGLAALLITTTQLATLPPAGGVQIDGALNQQQVAKDDRAQGRTEKPIVPLSSAAINQPAELSKDISSVTSASKNVVSDKLAAMQAPKAKEAPMAERKKVEEKAMATALSSATSAPAQLATPSAPVPAMPTGAMLKGGINGAGNAAAFGGAPGNAGMAQFREADAAVSNYQDEGRDRFEHVKVNTVKSVKEEPVSTFSIDVDTSSYSFMRAEINSNVLPQKDAVRVEELINYFPYSYEAPRDRDTPFKANVAVLPTPWNSKTKLIHVGIKGYQIEQKEKPHANLVFLIDTSGSMNQANKLPLLKNSLKLLLDTLKADDTVAIVTYAGNAGLALPPTPVSQKSSIIAVLDGLSSYGSTAGAEGIRLAYQQAQKNFDKNGVNRVLLATDGDFNVGITDPTELKGFVERERDSGIYLSVLGFGMGNYNDAMMQTLAQNGNGNAAYIDNLSEARKTLVEEAGSTLFTIAKDVKIQVEFNPAKVAEYRLIGYETRMLNREDFNNDKVDAGDIGSGHTVTALYEITPAGSDAKLIDDLRYQQKSETDKDVKEDSGEYAFVKIRYKEPESKESKLLTTPVDGKVEYKEFANAPQEARFAVAVAGFGQLLRGDSYVKALTYEDVISLAQAAKGTDEFGYRSEFINLVRLASHAVSLPAQQGGGYAPPSPPIMIQPAPVPLSPAE